MNSNSTAVKVGLEITGTGGRPVLTLIHGFAGSGHTWDYVRPRLEQDFQLALLDLPGHGGVPVQPEISLAHIAEAIATFLRQSVHGPRYLCGYSMGGRIALQVALSYPDAVTKLAVIGASPGIVDVVERAQRRQSDHELAAKIRAQGVEWFAEYWPSLPIFATQQELPADVQDWLHQARLANDPEGLALALEQWGTGQQEWLLPELSNLRCPTLLISGAKDEKYGALSDEMADEIPICSQVAIPDAGHAAHIEQPDAVVHELLSFFS